MTDLSKKLEARRDSLPPSSEYRAALDAERAACDEWRENQHMHYKGIFGEAPCHDGACPLCVKHDARRAAEQGKTK